jgi:pantoate--beta-alanine ligase
MRKAKANHDVCAISIFVNPTQFRAGEDFEKYPRNFERDAEMAEASGVDLIFAPSVDEMYPRKTTTVRVSGVTERWEGLHRPGHFDGVSTVVDKLFNIVQPDVAYFGLKDLQQCLVVRRMVEDLDMPLRLSFEETVRESDGLAMSSRNAYLSPELRQIAPTLYREICQVKESVRADGSAIDKQIEGAIKRLTDVGFVPDYLELVDLESMAPTRETNIPAAIICAAKLGTTRLIDNIRINV